MRGSQHQSLQDQQIERALQQFALQWRCAFFGHVRPSRPLYSHRLSTTRANVPTPQPYLRFTSPDGCASQRSLSPNCPCRDVVDVLVIAPAVPDKPLGVKTIRLGVLRLARLSRL